MSDPVRDKIEQAAAVDRLVVLLDKIGSRRQHDVLNSVTAVIDQAKGMSSEVVMLPIEMLAILHTLSLVGVHEYENRKEAGIADKN